MGPKDNLINKIEIYLSEKKQIKLQEIYLKKNKNNCAGKLSEKNNRRSAKRRNAKMECKIECNQDREPENAPKHACVPAGHMRIQVACGKVPHVALGGTNSFDGGVCGYLSAVICRCSAYSGAERDAF